MKCGSRISITKEGLASLLGFPEGVDIDVYSDWERDVYQIVLRSDQPVFIDGHQLTYQTEEGQMLLSVSEEPIDVIVKQSRNKRKPNGPKDVLDYFFESLNEIPENINSSKSDSNIET